MSQKKKFQMRGKQVLLLGLTALVITAGYYRWSVETEKYNSLPVANETLPAVNEEQPTDQREGEETKETNIGEKGFDQLRQERDSARSEAMEQWKKTGESGEASGETKQAAEKKVKAANEYTEKEKAIETLIRAKGYEDCFAHINETGVTVRVKGGEIDGSKVAQMKDIIVSETNVPVRNIKISAE